MLRILSSKFLFPLLFIAVVLNFTGGIILAEDKIIAVVNNEIITQKDLDDFTNFMNMQLSSRYEGAELKEKVEAMIPDLLNKLIEDRLILQQAKKDNIVIEEARIKARIEEMKSRYPSESKFYNELVSQGLTLSDIESKIKEQLLIFDMLELKIRNKITINPREVTDFYNQHTEEFVMPESRSVEGLTIKDEGEVEKVMELVRQGMDFDKISTVYNTQVNKLGLVKRGELKKEIEDVIFNLSSGEVSEPTRLNDACYIFKVDQVLPSRQYSLAEVQDIVYNRIYDLRMKEKLLQWLKELREKSYVEIK